jgi:putative spermidine/putrescine transport system permease protein
MDKVVGRVIGHKAILIAKGLSILIVFLLVSPFILGLVSLAKSLDIDWRGLWATHSSALWNSYSYAFLAAVITCFVAWLCTLLLFVYYDDAARRKLAVICLIPFFASTAARLFSWVLLFSSFGAVGRLLHFLQILPQQESPLSLPSTLVFALVTIYLPVAIFAFYSFGNTVPPSVEEAAAVLGANRLRINVNIRRRRLVWASVVTLVFVFISSHSAFMVPSVLGGSTGWFVSTSVDYLLNIALKRDAAFFLSNLDTLILASGLLGIGLSSYLIGKTREALLK